MPKILYVSNTANFSKFNKPYMQNLRAQGWIVDYASMGEEHITDCDNQYKIQIARSPFSLKNFLGFKELKKIIEDNKYDIIHCHTPMGGVLARIAAKNLWKQKKVKIIYTAHGFHFYKGAPLINWILYYPVERILSRYTDLLLTIVDEDFQRAKKVMHCQVRKLDGVGVNLSKFIPLTETEKEKVREKNHYEVNDFIISVIAETNKNKNQIMLLKQVNQLKAIIPSLKIILVGKETVSKARDYVKKNALEKYVDFLGYRNDIPELIGMSDIAFSASIREGLPVNIIESMACGIPVVASVNRGHSSILLNEWNGFLFNLKDSKQMVKKIVDLYNHNSLRKSISNHNIEDCRKYDLTGICNEINQIYKDLVSD